MKNLTKFHAIIADVFFQTQIWGVYQYVKDTF